MLLRLRILAFVLVALIVFGLSLGLLFTQREVIINRYNEEDRVTTLGAIWAQVGFSESLRLEREVVTRLDLDRLAAERKLEDDPQVVALMRLFNAQAPAGITAEALDRDGRLVGGPVGRDTAEIADPLLVRRVRAEGKAVHGFRRLANGGLAVVCILPLIDSGEFVGALAASTDALGAVRGIEAALGQTALLVDGTGQLLPAERASLLKALQAGIDNPDRRMLDLDLGGKLWSVAVIDVADVGGGRIGTLYMLRDETRAAFMARLLSRGSIALGAIILVVVAIILALYLLRAFRPLEAALDALRDLAAGRTSVARVLVTGSDEIGRLAAVVEGLRQQTILVSGLSSQHERRLRRQQRYIRRQMQVLADTLEPEVRRLMLDDLEGIEREARRQLEVTPVATGVQSDSLGPLAVAFERMTDRVTDQHRQLDTLVGELREALEDKNKLLHLQKEIAIASDMQASILPQRFPPLQEIDVAAAMAPAKDVGGDFYDCFELYDGTIAFVIADVSGKGIPAAFFMLITRTLLKATALSLREPGAVLEHVNELLAQENDQGMFVTVFYGILDVTTGMLQFVNAGHNPPLLLRGAGEVEFMPSTEGTAVAIMEGLTYREGSVRLAPGDSLVLYTDGLTEAFNAAEDMFGDDRLVAAAKEAVAKPAKWTVDHIFRSIERFVKGAVQYDDMTCLVCRYNGPPGAFLASREAETADVAN